MEKSCLHCTITQAHESRNEAMASQGVHQHLVDLFGLIFVAKPFMPSGNLAEDWSSMKLSWATSGSPIYLLHHWIPSCMVGTGRLLGARNLLLVGMATSLITNIIFGFAANVWTIMVFMGINGFGIATGWPSTIGIMAN